MSLQVIDDVTGEIKTEDYNVTHKETSEAFKKREQRKQRRSRDYTCTDMEKVCEVMHTLTSAQCGYLLVLQCFIDYDTSILKKPTHLKESMGKKDIKDVLGIVNRSTFGNFFNRCVKLGVLMQNEEGEFFINPDLHFKGTTNNRFFIKSFTTKVRGMLQVTKPEDLGKIYRMLPYVHYETNALCHNPEETNRRLIKPLARQELASLIGCVPETLSKTVKRLTVDREYVLARTTIGKHTMYTFNPYIFNRKHSNYIEPTQEVMFSFKVDK
ncbi:hypothetical protein ACQ4XT_00285 [Halobacillus faecis]